jgi:hypothetical protein
MKLYFQRFFFRIIKNYLFHAKTLLLLTFLVCGCTLQTVVNHDYPLEKNPASNTGFIAENEVLSAIVQIDVNTVDGYFPAKAALIIKKPSYLRLEMLPIIGTPDFFLAASPEKMSIFIPSKGKFYYGQPTGANLKKFLPWKFNIEDIVMIFTGTYPSLKEKDISYQSYQEKNIVRMEMKARSGISQIVWLREDNRVLKIVRNDESGKEVYTVKYIYGDAKNSIPEKITISMAEGITSLSVNFSDIKIEKATDLSVFDLAVPSDIDAIPLD